MLHAPGLLVHLVQRTRPAGRHFVGMFEHRFQIAGDHRQRRAQFVGNVGHEVLAHLLQQMQPGDVAHHHQVLAVAVAGDGDLQPEPVVDGGGQLQWLLVAPFFEILLEARVAHQVGHRMTGVLRLLQAQQTLGSRVPPLQISVAVEHDHCIPECSGRALHPVDHRLQLGAQTQVAALELVQVVEDFAPDAIAVWRRLVGLIALQPQQQTADLAQGPGQVSGEADDQRPGIFACDQARQQASSQYQQQAAH